MKSVLVALIGLMFVGIGERAEAASCGPSTCTPVCGGTCTYSTCTGAGARNITATSLPFVYRWSSDACDDSIPDGQVISQLPFSIGGAAGSSLPVNVSHNYRTCVAQTMSSPACAPTLSFNITYNGGWLHIDYSVTNGTVSGATSSFSGSCAQNGRSYGWGFPSGTSGGFDASWSPTPDYNGCTGTYCVSATGPGGNAGPVCRSINL